MKTVIGSTPNSYDPQEHSVAVIKLRATPKEHATGARGTLSQLLEDHTTEIPVEMRAEFCNPDTVNRSLRRDCAKTMPKNPASLCDLTLDEEWTITSDHERFLIHDSPLIGC